MSAMVRQYSEGGWCVFEGNKDWPVLLSFQMIGLSKFMWRIDCQKVSNKVFTERVNYT